LTRDWILILGTNAFRVNVVSPRLTEAYGLNEVLGDGYQAGGIENSLATQTPSGRVAQPQGICWWWADLQRSPQLF